MLTQAGHNIADVSKQLGHHSIRITVDTYYHWIPGANSSEVNELDLKSAPYPHPVMNHQIKKRLQILLTPCNYLVELRGIEPLTS